ncbi:M3 family oligoendopeptidase [Malonomonas rubra]|uniref:M3 family oligoendopeptidase n=1 Tax=Malonomonas rubra TaxID=57040 RepID=UPI0026EA2B0C|nr:M3 family oligoendopeptidase [Malonomonas rubra]
MTEQINWNLNPLYKTADDPEIDAHLKQLAAQADQFRNRYKSRVAQLDAVDLATALQNYEQLQSKGLLPYLYAQLLFSADSRPDQHKALFAKVREQWAKISEELLFFELEMMKVEKARFTKLTATTELSPYRHYLNQLRKGAHYTLSEEVEQALKRKDLSGKEGFSQLFEELTSSFSFDFVMPGETEIKEVTGEELLALLYHPEGAVRERAFTTFLNKHQENALVLTACFNNLLLDHERECALRNYPDLMTPTHLSSETEPEMVAQMMAVTEQNYGLAREYFALKMQLLGLKEMKNTDIYAPLPGSKRHFDIAEARKLVFDSFNSFSPQLATLADSFFSDQRIDCFPAPGKTGGAFCMGMLPGYQPYVLLNFTGNLRDVSTLAHELGHGVHFALSQDQNLYHYQAPLPMAETASVFGEMLLTRRMLDSEQDKQVRIELLCVKLEEIIATTFRQNALTRFEIAAHKKRAEGLLSPDDYCELWWQENAKLFGDAVQMIAPYRWGWAYISHFIHSRFYCYSYVFGELLVLALYQQYMEQGENFVPLYLDLLKAGGSAPPQELLNPFGIDLSDPGFWQKGYDFVRGLLMELKTLTSS